MTIEVDEVLEAIYETRERGGDQLDLVKSVCKIPISQELLTEVQKGGMANFSENRLSLTPKGTAAAEQIIRRKRLAQVLLYHVLKIKDLRLNDIACEFEHIVFPEIEESICTMMGHPTECPFGTKIPPGDCCKRMQSEVRQAVKSLNDMKSGEKGRIAYIRTLNQVNQHKFCSMGLKPGVIVEMHQKYPTLIVRISETEALQTEAVQTEIAMDKTVGNEIYVWIINNRA